ncbi:hypothetical protein [Streptomyces sp. AC512_CC834]|uniref:hypothetical protein n=1 Tax=Streptomyces sp. AC512_CC834 TaxID=2823691 RepID=UPI001C2659CB|nr:hypothetical protein [Streptomyces sp. AC512_CC834]
MNPHDDPREQPAEHLRFAAYLRELAQVTDAEETAVVTKVLTDPDQTMARSAVLRHLDRRATTLYLGPAFEPWAQALTQAAEHHPFLSRRLQEWSLLRAVILGQPWRSGDLLESSDWLQHNAAATSDTKALQILADSGRTKRIRNAARTNLAQPGNN